MTEEQKECEYCHFDSRGADFADDYADDGDTCYFQLDKFPGERDYINVWSGEGGEKFDVESEFINYCPMCGRKLGKEDA